MLYKLLIWATPPDPTPHQKKKNNKNQKKKKEINKKFIIFSISFDKKTVYLKLNINMEINLNVIVLDKIA